MLPIDPALYPLPGPPPPPPPPPPSLDEDEPLPLPVPLMIGIQGPSGGMKMVLEECLFFHGFCNRSSADTNAVDKGALTDLDDESDESR